MEKQEPRHQATLFDTCLDFEPLGYLAALRTAHSLSWFRSWTILMIFTGILYMMSQRLGRCSESKAFSKPMKFMTRGICHSYNCSIMLHKMNICSVVLLPCRNLPCSALSLLSAPLFKLAITRSVIPRQFVHSFKLPFFGSLTISLFNLSCGITLFSQIIWMTSCSFCVVSSFSQIIWMPLCSFCVVVLMSALNNSTTMLSTPAAFPFFRELIAFLTSPLLIGLVFISSISGTSLAVTTIEFGGGGLLRISSKCSFHLASLLESSVMVLPPLSLIAVFLWVPSMHMVFVMPYRVFMFPTSTACCASSSRLLSHSLLSDFKLFFTSLSLLLYFAHSCFWILSDLAFSALLLSGFCSSTFAHDSGLIHGCYFSLSYPMHSLLHYRLCWIGPTSYWYRDHHLLLLPKWQIDCEALG